MKIAAVIPMKSLHSAKSRLSNILTAQQRKNLAMYLLDATIKEIKKSCIISEIIIVSNDKAVKNYSCLNNLKFIKDSEEGVNKAVILADNYCIDNGINANIVIPHDLPFISAKEIDKICTMSNKYHKCIIICPSKRFDGTNILFRKPPDVIKTHYDDNSYMNHLKEAYKFKIPIESLDIVKLRFDLDTKEDLLELFPLENWNSVLKDYDKN
ncbi:MAG TPA: 2-phospho-L-lactate guanylyltransferase [Nitrososphaeraceae archaeon]|jgi:2-phospho-L-lactate/phosphoenolpyruvate guanylyltransferase|nr:2-phospho-L-lactate guanylyltransferase [Nitrososphaeraceae archaeon]